MPDAKRTAVVKVVAGRPWQYNEWVASEIIAELAEGKYLSHICRSSRMPHMSTVLEWVDKDVQGFRQRYLDARRHGAERMFESMMDVALNTSDDVEVKFDKDGMPYAQINGFAIQRSKLIIDTMRYSLSKLYPRRFGEMSEKIAERQDEQEAQEAKSTDIPVMPALTREEWMKMYSPQVINGTAQPVNEHDNVKSKK